MEVAQKTEFWMSGPVNNIPALLQPVAHTILQLQREIHQAMHDFPEALLWEKPFGLASTAFHLQHIPGVLDRLFTYAKPLALNTQQFRDLAEEGKKQPEVLLQHLLERMDRQIAKSLDELSNTDPGSLSDLRGVGRKQLPSTVLGLFFHAAEHSMRHTGQLIVTAACLKGAAVIQKAR
jgi:uncharacterized damage-inducible protein DinB